MTTPTTQECICEAPMERIAESETGADYLCGNGHGWTRLVPWGFEGRVRWQRDDRLAAVRERSRV